MIEVMVKRYGRAAGLRVTPHLWRHTCATHLVANGANLAAVQRQLGHKSLRTTQLYTRVAVPDLVRMHAKAHPRSRAVRATRADRRTTRTK
jgi:site-specific recombinase XerD